MGDNREIQEEIRQLVHHLGVHGVVCDGQQAHQLVKHQHCPASGKGKLRAGGRGGGRDGRTDRQRDRGRKESGRLLACYTNRRGSITGSTSQGLGVLEVALPRTS